MLGLKVHVPVVKEATGLGAAILAGCGAGIYPDRARAVKNKTINRQESGNPEE